MNSKIYGYFYLQVYLQIIYCIWFMVIYLYDIDFKFIFQKEKINKFSLNEDEDDLIYFGQFFFFIEKFEELFVSEDEEDGGRIDGQLYYVIYFFFLVFKNFECGKMFLF